MLKIILLVLLIATHSFSYTKILDFKFGKEISGEGGYKEYFYNNNSLETKRFKIHISKGKEKDMSKWVTVYPKVLNVPPQSIGIVKMHIQAPVGTPNGQYNCFISFIPVEIPVIAKTNAAGKNVVSGVANLKFAMRQQIYGYVGNPDFKNKIKVEDFELINGKVIARIKNNSFAMVYLGLKVYDTHKVQRADFNNFMGIQSEGVGNFYKFKLNSVIPEHGYFVIYNTSDGTKIYSGEY